MNTNNVFTPIAINEADAFNVAEYGYYCDDKINMGEMPASFIQWQEMNFDLKDMES